MPSVRVVLMVVVAAGLGVSCGGGDRLTTDGADASLAESREVAEPLQAGVNPPAAATAQPLAAATVQLEQPAVWPAADVVFDTPEEAAADFMGDYLDERPGGVLGEFRPGDARSGEIDVEYSSDPEGVDAGVRSTLLMRQLGPSDGWFVLAAVNELVTITSPESGSTIAPGPVTVEGVGQAFEGTIFVSAYPAGDRANLDATFTQTGTGFEPGPYSATLDLSAAPPGFVAIDVSGDSGLRNDVGPFTVIPVNIGLPGTR